jgi:hypothetical protein
MGIYLLRRSRNQECSLKMRGEQGVIKFQSTLPDAVIPTEATPRDANSTITVASRSGGTSLIPHRRQACLLALGKFEVPPLRSRSHHACPHAPALLRSG